MNRLESQETVVPVNSDSDTDADSVQDSAARRQHERAESVESMLDGTDGLLDEEKYPTTSEELSVEYADQMIELPNETESLGEVFDRLVGERFETPEEAREAVLNELTGEEAGPEEYNDERSLDDFDDDPADRR